MISHSQTNKGFEYENGFYKHSNPSRIAKIISQYELYKSTIDLQGSIVECGVFKGNSLIRFATFRELFGGQESKKIIGFDIFGKFPDTSYQQDQKLRQEFITNAGIEGASTKELTEILHQKGIDKNIELVQGDIIKTIPEYIKQKPEIKISLLHIDVDVYEPVVTILKYLYPKVVNHGLVILDDYGTFPGTNKAVDEFIQGKNIIIKKLPFSNTPSYFIKEYVS